MLPQVFVLLLPPLLPLIVASIAPAIFPRVIQKRQQQQQQQQNFSGTNDGGGIHWDDLSLTTVTNASHPILHSFSGCVPDGEICGVIGPSGSGKSSFLAALGGSSPHHVKGHIWMGKGANNNENNDGDRECENKNIAMGDKCRSSESIAFLRQNDAFFHTLTVRETLDLGVFLEFPQLSKDIRDGMVGSHLSSLGLAYISHRRIGDTSGEGGRGSLSGGERRRLSIGLELLADPRVFLADECTTGLDSAQANRVVRLIRDSVAIRNIPAILTMHQPRVSIWRMMNKVMILAPGGRVCYMGPREDVIEYFTALGYNCPFDTSPPEFLIDLVSIDTEDRSIGQDDERRINSLVAAFAKWQEVGRRHELSQKHQHIQRTDHQRDKEKEEIAKNMTLEGRAIVEIDSPIKIKAIIPIVNVARRMGTLLKRSLRQNLREKRYNVARFVASVGSSLLLSNNFRSVKKGSPLVRSLADRTALLSFGVINMSMMALMKTVHLFARERPVVLRELYRPQTSGSKSSTGGSEKGLYTPWEYLLSKSLAEMPLDVGFSAIFASILKCTTGLHISLRKLTATFSLMTVAGASLGFAVGALSGGTDGDSAMVLALPVMVAFMVVGVINPSGVNRTLPPPTLVIRLLKFASPIRLAIESLLIGEFKGMSFKGDRDSNEAVNRSSTTLAQYVSLWRSKINDLPKLGAFSMVKDGDHVLEVLGLETITYCGVMRHMMLLSMTNLLISWIGLKISVNKSRARHTNSHRLSVSPPSSYFNKNL